MSEADGRFGLCDVLPGVTKSGASWSQLAFNAGARVNRWEFRWDRMERRPGTWDFTPNEPAVTSSRVVGLSVLGILIGTPGWAAAPGQRPGNGVPRGLYAAYTDPRNVWAGYVRQTVTHWRGQVQWWEVWNEPDLPFFWAGSARDYFQLLKIAYLVIRDVDPAASVLLAGMVVPNLSFMRAVLSVARTERARQPDAVYFDIAAWHAYGPARNAYTDVRHVRTLLTEYEFDGTPVWVTEAGFPASNPNGEPRQAAYVVQTTAYALAAGADRVLVYRESDDPTPKSWGLLTVAGTPRMGYVSFQVVARYLAHVQSVSYAPVGGLERFVFYTPDTRVTMFWNRMARDQRIDVYPAQMSVGIVSWLGSVRSVAPVNGHLSVNVAAAPYNVNVDPREDVVGGPPVIETEGNSPLAHPGLQLYVPTVKGTKRQLILFNSGSAPVPYQVSIPSHPSRRVVGQARPMSLATVDVDLLLGSGYPGPFKVESAMSLANAVVSTEAFMPARMPSTSWYFAASPRVLTINNPGTTTSHVTVSVFAKGKSLHGAHFNVEPQSSVVWHFTGKQRLSRLTVVTRASTPVIVSAISGERSSPIPTGRRSWYILHPRRRTVAIFNPDPSPIQVTVTLVHGTALSMRQDRIAGRRSILVAPGSATAVSVQATAEVVAGYTVPASGEAAIAGEPSMQSSLTLAGSAGRVDLFNPSEQSAQVSLAFTSGSRLKQNSLLLAPSRIVSLRVRETSDPARGVLVRSDVPIVAAVR